VPGNTSTTGSVEDALDNLDPSLSEEPECENCQLPRSDMRVDRETTHRKKQSAKIATGVITRCAECGEQVDYHSLR